jgi:hypothetical protein
MTRTDASSSPVLVGMPSHRWEELDKAVLSGEKRANGSDQGGIGIDTGVELHIARSASGSGGLAVELNVDAGDYRHRIDLARLVGVSGVDESDSLAHKGRVGSQLVRDVDR